MDEQYTMLARHYDTLTFDVDYAGYAAFADQLFKKHKIPGNLILEQACGTGSLTLELSRLGYEMIASDLSPDMLVAAQEKCAELEQQPIFICQDMCELDLYGTADAAVCVGAALLFLDLVLELVRDARGKACLALFVQGEVFVLCLVVAMEALQLESGCAAYRAKCADNAQRVGIIPRNGAGKHHFFQRRALRCLHRKGGEFLMLAHVIPHAFLSPSSASF